MPDTLPASTTVPLLSVTNNLPVTLTVADVMLEPFAPAGPVAPAGPCGPVAPVLLVGTQAPPSHPNTCPVATPAVLTSTRSSKYELGVGSELKPWAILVST